MRKNGQKCLKKPENQQNGTHKKNMNSGLYLKILMPDYNNRLVIILPFPIRRATSVPLAKGTKFALHHRENVDNQMPRNTNFTH